MRDRVPLQVYIDHTTARRLRQEANRRGTSQSELIRQFISVGLQDVPREAADPLDRIVAMVDSGLGDLAARHDDYLAESARDPHTMP